MTTVRLRNTTTHPKILSWTRVLPPVPNAMNPAHRDVLRGDFGPHLVSEKVTIPAGSIGEVPADVWESILSRDSIVAAWITSAELELVEG